MLVLDECPWATVRQYSNSNAVFDYYEDPPPRGDGESRLVVLCHIPEVKS